MTKWGDRPHWEFDAVLLGSDEHGDWLGIPGGTHMSRPGAAYVAQPVRREAHRLESRLSGPRLVGPLRTTRRSQRRSAAD